MSGRCTGTYCSIVRTTEPIFHRNMPRGNIQYKFWDEEWIESRSTIACIKITHFLDEGNHTADSGGPYYTHSVFINTIRSDARIADSLLSSNHCNLRETV